MGAWECAKGGALVVALSNTGYGDSDTYPSNAFEVRGFAVTDAASATVLFQTPEGKGGVRFAGNALTGVLAPLQALVVSIQ